ncbi:unnamed protein product [Ilex paraguariensis]|uniref:Uncharacterized protein n=1 Tax=Ilex paraguariensis TaxID=185542 RepID=A0ABC8TDQ8_9AQUA
MSSRIFRDNAGRDFHTFTDLMKQLDSNGQLVFISVERPALLHLFYCIHNGTPSHFLPNPMHFSASTESRISWTIAPVLCSQQSLSVGFSYHHRSIFSAFEAESSYLHMETISVFLGFLFLSFQASYFDLSTSEGSQCTGLSLSAKVFFGNSSLNLFFLFISKLHYELHSFYFILISLIM